MKLHTMYPALGDPHNEKLAVIEFTWAEAVGLSELLTGTIQATNAGNKIILNFEKSITTSSPCISCVYESMENE